jgi:site-specific DNA-methyltransferase (adenine-specific)
MKAWASPNGSSTFYAMDSLAFLQNIQSGTIECVFTDPPFFLSNGGTTCSSGKRVSVNKGAWDKSKGAIADHQFNLNWLGECYRILKPNGVIWVCGTHHNIYSVGFALQTLGFRLLNHITWEKPNPPPNLGCRCFTHSAEFLIFATKAKSRKFRYQFNYEDIKAENDGKQQKDIWRIPTLRKWEKKFGSYPAQKPVELVTKALQATTRPGDLILDPFAGSSTTGVAALSIGRNYLGCDNDSRAIELSIKRLSEYS